MKSEGSGSVQRGHPGRLSSLYAAPGLLVKYFSALVRVTRVCKINYRATRTLFNEYIGEEPFLGGYHPIRHPDHFKAALLYSLCRGLKPQVVVETGVGGGNSSLGILSALSVNGFGHLHSIDLPEATYIRDDGSNWQDSLEGHQPAWLVPSGLRSIWDLRIGNTRDTLPKLVDELNSIDLFYHDSEHTLETVDFELETVLPKLSPAAVVLVDNTDWNEGFWQFCRKSHFEGAVVYPYLGVACRRQGRSGS